MRRNKPLSTKYQLAALLGKCEREFKNDIPMRDAVCAYVSEAMRGLS